MFHVKHYFLSIESVMFHVKHYFMFKKQCYVSHKSYIYIGIARFLKFNIVTDLSSILTDLITMFYVSISSHCYKALSYNRKIIYTLNI